MVAYAIDAARSSGLFDHIVVSTDDDEIAAIALYYGAEVPFRRPAELADDLTPTVPVVAHAVEACQKMGWQAEDVCCIYPGVPLIDPGDLGSALDLLKSGAGLYAFPVTGFRSPIQRALKRLSDGTVTPFYPEHAGTRTQDLDPAYHDAGQFYWGRADAWLSGANIHLNGATIVLPEWRVVDIDTMDDWARAEAIFALSRQGQ